MSYAYYFPHDFYARQDTKMQHLLATHGVAGVGLYWCIVEQLFEQDGALPMSSVKIIAWQLHCDIQLVESVINDFELFVTDGDFFWSESAKARLKAIKDKSETNRKNVQKRYEKKQPKNDGTTTELQPKNDGTTTEEQNKRKEIKKEEIKKDKKDTSLDVSNNTAATSVDSLREKSSWIESVAMNYGLKSAQEVMKWIDKFQLEVIDCKLKTHANHKDLTSHFCDWLRIKLDAESAQRKPSDRMQTTNDKLAAYIQTLNN